MRRMRYKNAQKIVKRAKILHIKLQIEKILKRTNTSMIIMCNDYVINIDKNSAISRGRVEQSRVMEASECCQY